MGQHFLTGNPPVALTLRHSARARRISLRVSALDGRVTLTVPRGVSENEALDFARQKEAWLRDHLARQEPDVRVGPGVDLPILGRPRRIVTGQPGRGLMLSDDTLYVPGAPEDAAARVLGWIKVQARARLAFASDGYARELGVSYSGLTLRDTRSRWGSCSSAGRLNYSWRLMLCPSEVLDYVAAHEVSHLIEMNHSRAFWRVVEGLCPDWRDHRDWLRANGAGLHRYRFQD